MPKKMYSTELKLEIVQRYLKGDISLKPLAEQYCVDRGDIQKWRDAYLEHGVAGLCPQRRTYTGDFKVSVVEYMHNTGASIRKTAAHFNIASPPTVGIWKRIYDECGKDALLEASRGKGRVIKMKKDSHHKSQDVMKQNKELLAELQYLRMENEYLKKLNALVQERENSKKPTK